jgi:hypothetical protein
MAKAGWLALLIIAMIANARSIHLRILNLDPDLMTRAVHDDCSNPDRRYFGGSCKSRMVGKAYTGLFVIMTISNPQ